MDDAQEPVTATVTVGVVVPVRNAAPFLSQTLAGVQAQTRRDWTGVIVVNDSTDATLAVARSHAETDGRWEVVEAAEPGVARARNAGLAHLFERDPHLSAVWFLDGDDLPDADLIDRLSAALEARPDAPAAHAPVRFIDDAGRPVEIAGDLARRLDRRVRGGGKLRLLRDDEPTGRAALAAWPCVVTPGAALVRASAAREVGDWNANLKIGEDWEYWFRLARRGPLAYEPSPVLSYRLHPHSANAGRGRAAGLMRARRAILSAAGDADERRSIRRGFRLVQRDLAARRLRESASLLRQGRPLPAARRFANAAANFALGIFPVV